MSIKISVIICTHNRAMYLRKAIQSLTVQTLPKEQYEVIVVDNASEDQTRQVCMELGAWGTEKNNNISCPICQALPSLYYLFEPILGLSQARNTGWQSAKGEYIVYLDDDAIADSKWLQKIIEAFESIDPQPGAIGGKVEPIWEGLRPEWLSDDFLGQLTLLDWGPIPIVLDEEKWLVGTNIAVPRKVLEEVGGFKVALGRKGNNLLSMEEILLVKEISGKGYKCFYDPRVVVRHHVLPSRLNKKWFIERAYWNGASSALIDDYIVQMSSFRRLLKSTSTILRILLSPNDLLYWLIPTNKKYNFMKKCSVYARIGYAKELVIIKNRIKSKLDIFISHTSYTDLAAIKKLRFIYLEIEKHCSIKKKDIKDLHILDVGCGKGGIAFPLASLGCHVRAFDINESFVKSIQSQSNQNKVQNIMVTVDDAYTFDDGNVYDVIIASEIFEHVSQPSMLAANIARRMTAGSCLIVTIPNGYGPWELGNRVNPLRYLAKKRWLRHMLGRSPYHEDKGARHYQFYTKKRLIELFAKFKLKPVAFAKSDVFLTLFPYLRGISFLRKIDITLADVFPHWLVSGWYFVFKMESDIHPQTEN